MKGEAAREFQFDYAPFGALPINQAVTPPNFPAKSWIVEDWFHPVPEPAASLPRLQVSFHLLMNDSSTREYVVLYVFDAAAGQGFIHLPGKGEQFYEANIFTVLRGPEYDGRWFRASAQWMEKARAALAAARRRGSILGAALFSCPPAHLGHEASRWTSQGILQPNVAQQGICARAQLVVERTLVG
jgi:hypothetical protein